jgi:tRNA modification GTPase
MSAGLVAGDIIAAIATPPGRGGVGIVRISGPALQAWAAPLLGRSLAARTIKARTPIRANFVDQAGRAIDDGLALYFPAPASYTGEDVIELHGHGGPVVMNLLLARCIELGARLAAPGEFTRRAYLAGKLDLAQAEAVADLIDASTATAARSAVRSLRGEFSAAIHALVDQLITLRALTEATLDFPEEEIDPIHRIDAERRLVDLRAAVADARARGRQGSLLRTGLNVVIAGRPNVGKSSLLNRLAGDEVAIVTPIAGTTRDTVRQAIEIEGIALNIIDTAGLRETVDVVERVGIDRTWREIERADVVLIVRDATESAADPAAAADEAIVERIDARVPRLIVHNKIDLAHIEPRLEAGRVWLSAKSGAGIELLRRALLDIAGWQPGGEDVFMARERHLQALAQAETHLALAANQFSRIELFAEELRVAQDALNAITGEFSADDLLGEIFGRFCIGK